MKINAKEKNEAEGREEMSDDASSHKMTGASLNEDVSFD